MTADVEVPSRKERVFFKSCGVISICVGVVLLTLFAWLALGQWFKISRWPHVTATVESKDVSRVGARLVFSYRVDGRRVSGLGFRWGSEQEIRDSLATYERGAIQVITYNPQDPNEVNTYTTYTWMAFRPELWGAVLGLLFIAGGLKVRNWAHA